MTNIAELQCRLTDTAATVQSLVGALPAGALAYREAPERWTPFEVVCHLADSEEHNWIPRLRVILSDAVDKTFAPFDREAGLRRYADWPVAAVLNEFQKRRQHNVRALGTFHLQPDDLRRQGTHPGLGPVTLDHLLACWLTHDYAHLAQICRSLVRHTGRDVGPWTAYFSLLRD